jgi:hypothetical protein
MAGKNCQKNPTGEIIAGKNYQKNHTGEINGW